MRNIFGFAFLMLFSACINQRVDLIVHNAQIYTVNSNFAVAEAMAIQDVKIVAIGTDDDILKEYYTELKKPITSIFLGTKVINYNLQCIDCYNRYIENTIDIIGSNKSVDKINEVRENLKKVKRTELVPYIDYKSYIQKFMVQDKLKSFVENKKK